MKLDRNHSEDVYTILKLHEIIKRYELLVEHLLAYSLNSDKETQLKAAITECNGNVTEAAKLLGIERVTIYRRMKKYGIELEGL